MANLIVKVTNGTEIRRFTATSDTLTWSHLSKRCAEMFDLMGSLDPKPFKLTYVDDEGDRITLSSDAELDEAKSMAFTATPPVLRLSVVVAPVASASKGSSCDVAMSDASTEPEAKTTADAGTHAKPTTADAATTHGRGRAATADAGTNCNYTNRSTASGTTSPPPAQVPAELSSLFHSLARELPTLVSQLPESVRAFLPRAELDLAATLAATRAANQSAAEACQAAGQAVGHAAAAAAAATGTATATATSTGNATTTNGNNTAAAAAAATHDVPMPEGFLPVAGCHPGVRCDRTGECPIRGNRYNMVGRNYDLCESEYLKLSESDKALYVKIPPPAVPPVHTMEPPSSGASPGMNAGLGADMASQGFHPGVECDRSGMCPIVGVRYNLKGHDYDLCQREFDKLPSAEKLMYTPIPPVCHRGRPGPHRAFAFGGGPFGGGGFGGGFGRPPHCTPHGWGGGGGWGGAGPHGGWGGAGPHSNRTAPVCGGTGTGPNGHGNNNRLAARFVRDVSIFDGTQMAPATRFTKIWRLKNSGELPWPPGTRMLFVGGDQMTAEMSVPLSRATPVMPGEEVDVDVEMIAPREHGRYLGYWRLMGPRGRKFGQRVWCHVQVVDPAVAPDVTEQSLADAAAELAQKKASLADADADEVDAEEATAEEAAAQKLVAEALLAATAEKIVEDAINNAVGSAEAAEEAKAKAKTEAEAEAKAKTAAPLVAAAAPPTVGAAEGSTSTTAAAAAAVAKEEAALAKATIPASPSADGNLSDASDGVLVETSDAADPNSTEGVALALASMGFTDKAMVEAALHKHGADLDACASDLALASEWDSLLDDLAEMGFENRDLNKALMLRHDGNLKRTVKALVEDA